MKQSVGLVITILSIASCGGGDPGSVSSPVKGFWIDCIGSVNNSAVSRGLILEFTDTEFRTYDHRYSSSNECLGNLTLADTIQSGTYEVIGTGTSEEGLPIYDLKMRVLTVFGSAQVDDIVFDQYFYVHIDHDVLYAGVVSGEASFNGLSKSLDLGRPYRKR